mmetsp:Transcript_56683/g.175755  ORF Transcript_56683/g.175755 Transcript_56683/m.175755 type:complete len:206 (-) Transcript_56683:233-850(-)
MEAGGCPASAAVQEVPRGHPVGPVRVRAGARGQPAAAARHGPRAQGPVVGHDGRGVAALPDAPPAVGWPAPRRDLQELVVPNEPMECRGPADEGHPLGQGVLPDCEGQRACFTVLLVQYLPRALQQVGAAHPDVGVPNARPQAEVIRELPAAKVVTVEEKHGTVGLSKRRPPTKLCASVVLAPHLPGRRCDGPAHLHGARNCIWA